ncbi:fimbrial protein [Enterobacter kobei]|uniref:fimbrial protein n=1 Tax=Enterobacter kobei TaxID=208224 RepID=UPI00125BDB46|nr:fimbrial protein [Enterobacter kobei]ELE9245197.1 fimbrial protein [Enterobacter kobei]VAL08363.1 fimbrial protein domain-containing protein [Enterobacter kobei]
MKVLIILKVAVLALILSAQSVLAASCESEYSYSEFTQPVQAVINVGQDMPVGSVIYSMQMSSTSNRVGISCNNEGKSWTANVYFIISSTPGGPSFNFSGNTLNGEVFPTNVDGIGVAILKSHGDQTITLSTPYNQPMSSSGTTNTTSVLRKPSLMMALVKTGPIAPGTVDASSFPTVKMTAVDSPTISEGFPFDMMAMRFSGRILVQSETCQTHDKTVNLGRHEISDKFNGIGSVTEWIDSSIELTGCPVKGFPGYYSTTGPQIASNGGSASGGTLIANKLLVTITANTGLIDATRGLININTTQAGAASGVGIQLGYGDNSAPSVWNLTSPQEYVLPTEFSPTNGSINIPVFARYYQTENIVTPGKADGQVMFTINYQ